MPGVAEYYATLFEPTASRRVFWRRVTMDDQSKLRQPTAPFLVRGGQRAGERARLYDPIAVAVFSIEVPIRRPTWIAILG
jgi:hypothetical protein